MGIQHEPSEDKSKEKVVPRREEERLYGQFDQYRCDSINEFRGVFGGFSQSDNRDVCTWGDRHRYLSSTSGGITSELIETMEAQLACNKNAIHNLEEQNKQIEDTLSRLKELQKDLNESE